MSPSPWADKKRLFEGNLTEKQTAEKCSNRRKQLPPFSVAHFSVSGYEWKECVVFAVLAG